MCAVSSTVVTPKMQRTQPHMSAYVVVSEYVIEHRYAPTMNEIAERIGMTYWRTRRVLIELRAEGSIDWLHGKARTIHIT